MISAANPTFLEGLKLERGVKKKFEKKILRSSQLIDHEGRGSDLDGFACPSPESRLKR